jgi:hypothetical protein
MTRCPIDGCPAQVAGDLRICSTHYKLVPRPQQSALASFARSHKGGPAHRAAFERACESVTNGLEGRRGRPLQARAVALPYRDD